MREFIGEEVVTSENRVNFARDNSKSCPRGGVGRGGEGALSRTAGSQHLLREGNSLPFLQLENAGDQYRGSERKG